MSSRIRILCAGLLIAVGIGGQHAANAQTSFTVTAMTLQEPSLSDRTLTQQEIDTTFFNLGRCECGEVLNVKISITPDLSNTTAQLIFASGSNCLTNENTFKDQDCRILEQEKVNQWNQQQDIHESIADIMTKPGQACDSAGASTTNLTVFVSASGDGSYAQASGAKPTLQIGVDTAPPPAPSAGDAPIGGDGLVTVYFDVATRGGSTDADGGTDNSSRDPDVDKTQVLCEVQADNGEWLAPNIDPEKAEYVSESTLFADEGDNLCPNISDESRAAFETEEVTLPEIPASSSEEGGPLPVLRVAGGIETLHPAYACSDAISATTGSIAVSGLQNSRTYRFYVLSMDKAKNPSALVALGTATPGPSEDFWERYKRSGGSATGCATGTGGLEMGVLGIIASALLMQQRRARRRGQA